MPKQEPKEGYPRLGRSGRRLVIKLWKESGTDLSLKEWARKAQVGDIAQAWAASKGLIK